MKEVMLASLTEQLRAAQQVARVSTLRPHADIFFVDDGDQRRLAILATTPGAHGRRYVFVEWAQPLAESELIEQVRAELGRAPEIVQSSRVERLP
jgi:hypothetical protein